MSLRTQARLSNFGNAITAEIKKQVIKGGRCSKLRQHILETPGMTLDNIITRARTQEADGVQLKEMDKATIKQEVKYKNEPISVVWSSHRTNNKEQGGYTFK